MKSKLPMGNHWVPNTPAEIGWTKGPTTLLVFLIFICNPHASLGQASNNPPKGPFQIVFDNRLDSLERHQRLQDVDIYVMDQYGEHVHRLTSDHKSHSPSWSPDGKRIAYLSDDQPLIYSDEKDSVLEAWYKAMQRDQSLYWINADGTKPAKIGPFGPDVQDVVWLPDNNGIGLRNSDRKNLNVYLSHGRSYDAPFDKVDTVAQVLKRGEEGGHAWAGASLAELFPNTNDYLPAFLLHTGKVGPLTQREIYAPWSRMSFVPDVKAYLSAMSLDGAPENLPSTAFDTVWTDDGKSIAYSRFLDNEGATLFAAQTKNGKSLNAHPLTQASLDAHDPAWSADGKRLAFEGRWDGSQQIFLINADGSNLLQLSRDSLKSCAHPSWSPDEKWIVAECKWNTADSNFPFHPFFELEGWYSSIYLFDVKKPTAEPRVLLDCGTNLGLEHSVDDRRCGAHNPSFAPAKHRREDPQSLRVTQ